MKIQNERNRTEINQMLLVNAIAKKKKGFVLFSQKVWKQKKKKNSL